MLDAPAHAKKAQPKRRLIAGRTSGVTRLEI
jgi:hypothetical protein